MGSPEEFITSAEARAMFPYKVEASALRRLVELGKVRTVKIDGLHPRYSRVDILSLIASATEPTHDNA